MIIAVVGMPGSGKSTVASIISKLMNCKVVRFGDITDKILKERGMEINEENEKRVREELRKKYGNDAYAKLNKQRIDECLEKDGIVVVDGLYSWEEYLYLKKNYPDKLVIVHVFASPKSRYERLKNRPVRPLSVEEAMKRDYAEIENLNKGGPIAMADFVIINESSLEDLQKAVSELVDTLKQQLA